MNTFVNRVKRLFCKSDVKKSRKDPCDDNFWCIGLCRFCGVNDCVKDDLKIRKEKKTTHE